MGLFRKWKYCGGSSFFLPIFKMFRVSNLMQIYVYIYWGDGVVGLGCKNCLRI